MKEIIIHLIDKTYDNIEGCVVILLAFGMIIIIPVVLVLLNAIK